MAVLDTAIHAFPQKCSESNVLGGTTWMRGSSPRMTAESDADLTHDAIIQAAEKLGPFRL
jgi:hypothetical protein